MSLGVRLKKIHLVNIRACL